MASKTVLLIGEWLSSNLGDKVLCTCCEKYLKQQIPHFDYIKVDMTWGKLESSKTTVSFSQRIRYRIARDLFGRKYVTALQQTAKNKVASYLTEIKQSSKSIDAIIFCGGQMFLDYFTPSLETIISFAEANNIPIYWNAVGASTNKYFNFSTIKRVLKSKQNRAITYRDSEVLFNKYVTCPHNMTPDTALLTREIYQCERKQSNVVGVGAMSFGLVSKILGRDISEQEQVELYREIIQKIEAQGYKWQLFSNGCLDDQRCAEKVLTALGHDNAGEYIAKRPITDSDLVHQISTYHAIISFRLHSHIIAYSLGIPGFGYTWDNKVADFYNLIGEPNNCTSSGVFSSQHVSNFLNNLHVNQFVRSSLIENVKQNLNNYIVNPLLQAESEKNPHRTTVCYSNINTNLESTDNEQITPPTHTL